MISASLLVGRRGASGTQDLRVHWKPRGVPLSVSRGRTQDSSIRVSLLRASSARIRQISDIAASEYLGALYYRDNLSGAPTIPVNQKEARP